MAASSRSSKKAAAEFLPEHAAAVGLDTAAFTRCLDSQRHRVRPQADRALSRTVEYFKPRYVVGVGKFAEQRAKTALGQHPVKIGMIAHPSPANPQANRGWELLIEKQLSELGIKMGS